MAIKYGQKIVTLRQPRYSLVTLVTIEVPMACVRTRRKRAKINNLIDYLHMKGDA